jgi:hypothetical protein
VLDNIMLILHREDLIPDLRRRQLIRAECFLMLARVLESKSLFGGTKIEQSEYSTKLEHTSRQQRRHKRKEVYMNSTIHDPSKDLYHTISQKKDQDPNKVGKYSIFQMKDGGNGRERDASQDNLSSAITACTDDSSTFSEEYDDEISVLSRSSSSAGSMSKPLHQSLFTAAISKSPNKYNRQKDQGKQHLLPRQTVISGAGLDREPVTFPGVSPYDAVATDTRVGYQKSRLWVPNAGSGVCVLMID